MSQTYAQRRATVEQALNEENVKPSKGKSVSDVAVSVLRALDGIRENVR
jgi:hypothetical protein